MPESNPALIVVHILQLLRSGVMVKKKQTNERMYTLRAVLGVAGEGGFTFLQSITAFGSVLDWLEECTLSMHPLKAERFKKCCQAVRDRLDWEFGDRQARAEPHLNVDALISDFENMAMDLEIASPFRSIADTEVDRWEELVEELYGAIADSGLDRDARSLMLDVVACLRGAIRDLREFGTVASAERLRDAMGRLVAFRVTVQGQESAAKPWLEKAWSVVVQISAGVETVAKFKTIGEIYKALPWTSKA